MKRQGSTELPRFAVGALAIAGASAANGATVQITFNNSYVSSTSGWVNLDADFGNDGNTDLYAGWNEGLAAVYSAGAAVLGYGYNVGANNGLLVVGDVASGFALSGSASVRDLVWISFTDAGIRAGAPTTGYLDLTAAFVGSEFSVTVNRLIFDDASTTAPTGVAYMDAAFTEYGTSAVPEASTSLGLLALGAGGLLTRRRQKRAA